MIWFTADTHFGHKNIIKYEDRYSGLDILGHAYYFKNTEEMDAHIIEMWNSYVKPDDLVYHLGDFAFANKNKTAEIREQLNGSIVLIKGNHDKKIADSLFLDTFDSLEEKFILEDEKLYVTLSHYPMLCWNKSHYGSWNLFGHVHKLYKFNPYAARSMNVGWDIWNKPISLDEVATVFYKQFKEKFKISENAGREIFYNADSEW